VIIYDTVCLKKKKFIWVW